MSDSEASRSASGGSYRLDRSAFSVTTLDGQDDAVAYWRLQSPLERIAAVDYLRRMAYGPAASARLQRVLEVATLGGD